MSTYLLYYCVVYTVARLCTGVWTDGWEQDPKYQPFFSRYLGATVGTRVAALCNWLLNLPPFHWSWESRTPLFIFVWGFTRNGKWCWLPYVARDQYPQLFLNGVICIRVMLPGWVGVQLRWSGSTTKISYWQGGLGWGHNGRIKPVIFRFLDDASSAKGELNPNTDQSLGWEFGGK